LRKKSTERKEEKKAKIITKIVPLRRTQTFAEYDIIKPQVKPDDEGI
jgi:hypothetical protein